MHFRTITTALAILSLALSGLASPVAAQENTNELKAALLFNILRFVDVGVATNGTVNLCVSSTVPALREIGGLHRRPLASRTVIVREVSEGKVHDCHVAYLGSDGTDEIRRSSASGRALVGDGSAFVNAGGTIGFVRMGNQVRFEINVRSARTAGVDISSKLLRLASRVRQ